jgi:hypothetical protein
MLECLLATMKINQEDLLARLQAKMDTTLTIMKEAMQVGIHSIQSELENKNQQMQNLRKEITETIERTQVKLQIVEVALDAQAKEFQEEIVAIRADVTSAKKHGTFYETRSQIEATKREPQARVEAVEARSQLGRVEGVFASAVQPPIFNGNTSWAVFRRQFETEAEHNCWTRQEKSTYLITSLQGLATDMLHGIM